MESHRTIADGTSGGIEQESLTFDLCRTLVDRWLLIPEKEIVEALRLAVRQLHVRIEGAAALAVAGLLQDGNRYAGAGAAVILSGGNITEEALKEIVSGDSSRSLSE
jgi:threonine dehydratase